VAQGTLAGAGVSKMNWPSLHDESSDALADVLKQAIHKRPKDLFAFVADALQKRSGYDQAEFEKFFEECKQKPRTYVLEDRCPAGQDVYSWIPLRFSDQTILKSVNNRVDDLLAEMTSGLPVGDLKSFFDRVCLACPEVMYIRASPSEEITDFSSMRPEELYFFQTVRSIYLSITTSDAAAEHETSEMDFRCTSLLAESRAVIAASVLQPEMLQVVLVVTLLRAVGSNESFQHRLGGDHNLAGAAAVHAIEREAVSMPSYLNLSNEKKRLVKGILQDFVPLASLVSAEAVPVELLQVKEDLAEVEGGLDVVLSAMFADHVANCRSQEVPPESVDILRATCQCVHSLKQYSGPRSYEMILKRRAESHDWRIVRDDHTAKATVRICCFAGIEDSKVWNDIQKTVEQLPDAEKDALKMELARKDGCAESPVYKCLGAGRFVEAGIKNASISTRALLLLLARVLEGVAKEYDRSVTPNERVVILYMDDLVRKATTHTSSCPEPFEDTHFFFENAGPCQVRVRVSGAS